MSNDEQGEYMVMPVTQKVTKADRTMFQNEHWGAYTEIWAVIDRLGGAA